MLIRFPLGMARILGACERFHLTLSAFTELPEDEQIMILAYHDNRTEQRKEALKELRNSFESQSSEKNPIFTPEVAILLALAEINHG